MAEILLVRYTAVAGDRAQRQEQRQGGTGGNYSPAPQSTTESNRGSQAGARAPLWIQLPVSHWEPISLCSHLEPLSPTPGRNDDFQLELAAHYCDNLHTD